MKYSIEVLIHTLLTVLTEIPQYFNCSNITQLSPVLKIERYVFSCEYSSSFYFSLLHVFVQFMQFDFIQNLNIVY